MDAGKRQEAISHGEGQGDIGISRQYFATAGAHVDFHPAQLKELESSLSMQAHTSRYVDSHVHAWHACATQVSNWFVNARKRIWQQMLEDEFGREQASTMMGGPAAKSPMGKGNHKSRCCVSADRPDLFVFSKMDLVSAQWTHTPSHLSQMQQAKSAKAEKKCSPRLIPLAVPLYPSCRRSWHRVGSQGCQGWRHKRWQTFLFSSSCRRLSLRLRAPLPRRLGGPSEARKRASEGGAEQQRRIECARALLTMTRRLSTPPGELVV